MEHRIELERRGKQPSEIFDLNLDNCRTTQIEGLTEEYTSLSSLSMINVGLTNLKEFPKLPNLRKLELSDNRISGGLSVLQGCPKLSHLNVSGNKIKDLEALEPLKSLESLTHLDLFNNPLGNEDDYRNKVFKLIPSLKYLDGTDINDEEDEDSDLEDGQNGAEEEDEEDDEEGGEEEAEADGEDGEEDEDDEEDDDEDDEDGPGLEAIYKDNLDDDDDGDDFDGEGEQEEDEDHEIEEEEEGQPGGKRRKVDEEDGKAE